MSVTLALDASGKTASVCIVRAAAVLFEQRLDEGLTHSETLLPLVIRALDGAGLSMDGVDALAVTAGPGSFTGLRIGMALAKGLAFPRGLPLAAVSTLEALALASGAEGRVVSALDARRGEVYWAAFDMGPKEWQRLTSDAAGPAAEIAETLDLDEKPVVFVGDGAELCYNKYNYGNRSVKALALPGRSLAFGAALLARPLLENGLAGSAAGARCSYLRLSQAQRQRAQQLGL